MAADRTPEQIRTQGNHLSAERSLYLQQHARNPVDWHPWGEAALALAREADRPIFLSIGYSSCHWCHVMEHEVFEHDEVAALVNAHFVCIKVDREERPDLDAVYMEAVQAMTGRGGWPMSVFLTPTLKPFWGGTYLPRDAFLQLGRQVAEVWETRRAEIEHQSEQIAAGVNRLFTDAGGALDAELTDRLARGALNAYDAEWGGFRQQQKFPTPVRWRFLLHAWRRSGDPALRAAIEHTLGAMASGGIHDQLGGAFHRYTTEETWLIPHFEIMLYDNAQLAGLYLEAGAALGEPRWSAVAVDVLDFLLEAMRGPDGELYASYDADSGGEEGSFYVWTPDEITAVVGEADGPLLATLLGVGERGNFEGANVLTRRVDPAAAAQRAGRSAEETAALFDTHRRALHAARARRTWPGLDRKVVTAWNGLALSALARAGAVLDRPRYLDAARELADFLWVRHRDARGRLVRASTDGVTAGEGILDDYAFLAGGLLDLYQATGDPEPLRRADALLALARDLFADAETGFALTPADVAAPLGRRTELFDSVEPSGVSELLNVLVRHAALKGDLATLQLATATLERYAGLMDRAGLEMAGWADAAGFLTHDFHDVVIAGDPEDPATRALVRAFWEPAPADAVLAVVPADGPDAALAALLPGTVGKTALDGRPAAYVCRFGACDRPVQTPDALRTRLRGAAD